MNPRDMTQYSRDDVAPLKADGATRLAVKAETLDEFDSINAPALQPSIHADLPFK